MSNNPDAVAVQRIERSESATVDICDDYSYPGACCKYADPRELHNHETMVINRFLQEPDDSRFAEVFTIFTPQVVSFYRARGCEPFLAEDLAQDVMMTVHQKAWQIRDRTLFRAWLFKIARHTLCRHYGRRARELETVNLADGAENSFSEGKGLPGSPAFEFHRWMNFLSAVERETMTLRFLEQWEYHEIASAQNIPVGTVQWRVFNAKKKLAPHLGGSSAWRRAASIASMMIQVEEVSLS
jgi:RNA polymerase sigma-70 factor, ECF subfamily